MASGLDNLFTTYGENYGALGAFQSGQRRGLADAATRLSNEQRAAETQRYTGETPTYLQQKRQELEKSRIGNLQGQSDELAGVYGAKSQENLATSKQKALEAQQAWERLPEEHKTKMLNAVKTKQMEFFNIVEQTLAQTNDVPSTVSVLEQQYPDITKDPSWSMAKQRVSKMAPEQAMNEIRKMKASMASSAAYGSPETQKDMILEDQRQAGRMALGQQTGQFGMQEAQTRAAAASAPNKENTTMAIRRLAGIIADPNTSEQEKAAAEYELQAQLKFGQQTESSGVDPMFDVNKSKVLPPRPGQAPQGGDMASLAKQSFGSYEPSKYDYRINPSTGKLQRKPK